MKKRSSIIVALLIFVALVAVISPLETVVGSIQEQNNINDSKPNEQELVEFNKLLEENTYHYYNSLNETQKDAYEVMYTSFMSFEDSFSICTTADEANDIFVAVLYDNPHIFWVSNNYKYVENTSSITFNPEYRLTETESNEISQKLNKKVNEIVSSIETSSSEYEKELYIHNYVCENTVYDENTFNSDGDTAYGALLNGKAICEGYSRAIQILLDAVDIDNYLVIGDGITDVKIEPHMWNIVNINGSNYHLDATWNDSGADNSILYFYFNVTDEYIQRDHSNIVPLNNNCFTNMFNYFIVTDSYVDVFNGYNGHLSRSVNALSAGQNQVEFLFKDSTDLKKAVSYIEKDIGFFNYIYTCVKQSGRNLNPYEIEYYTIDEQNYLCIVFKED